MEVFLESTSHHLLPPTMAREGCDEKVSLPMAMALSVSPVVANYHPYPAALARYEDVVANPQLFMSTLESLHSVMATKFMIPIIGGRDLDLHKLFVEVTSRGGIEKVIKDRRWKEVTAVFNFPSTATNASFVLRKYYISLLHHYEQIYYFKARGWAPLQSPIPSTCNSAEPEPSSRPSAASSSSSLPLGFSVTGVIDGKFDSGYLVSVSIGSETLKGVLYQPHDYSPAISNRRRRRKKSEIRRRDPAHPKPNRSGYNFFFAEQHAVLKPLHPGKDRDISRMIGELWMKLKEDERGVYQEKALRDKERYRVEMEGYRKRLKVEDVIPLQQLLPPPPEPDLPRQPEKDDGFSRSESGSDPGSGSGPDFGTAVRNPQKSPDDEGFELRKRAPEMREDSEGSSRSGGVPLKCMGPGD